MNRDRIYHSSHYFISGIKLVPKENFAQTITQSDIDMINSASINELFINKNFDFQVWQKLSDNFPTKFTKFEIDFHLSYRESQVFDYRIFELPLFSNNKRMIQCRNIHFDRRSISILSTKLIDYVEFKNCKMENPNIFSGLLFQCRIFKASNCLLSNLPDFTSNIQKIDLYGNRITRINHYSSMKEITVYSQNHQLVDASTVDYYKKLIPRSCFFENYTPRRRARPNDEFEQEMDREDDILFERNDGIVSNDGRRVPRYPQFLTQNLEATAEQQDLQTHIKESICLDSNDYITGEDFQRDKLLIVILSSNSNGTASIAWCYEAEGLINWFNHLKQQGTDYLSLPNSRTLLIPDLAIDIFTTNQIFALEKAENRFIRYEREGLKQLYKLKPLKTNQFRTLSKSSLPALSSFTNA